MSVLAAHSATRTTVAPSMSWYLPPTHRLLTRSIELVDAITVKGPKGPAAIRRLRDSGFDGPVMFDGCGYADAPLPPPIEWIAEQRAAAADRLLLPGAFVPWSKDDEFGLAAVVKDEAALARDLEATMLLAVDSRWLSRKTDVLAECLGEAGVPVGLILGHRADPLSTAAAIAGLRWIARRVPHLSLIRSDHGALGAVAFGAEHAAIGLTTSNRHYAPAGAGARRLPDGSARVFVRPLLDWFRASEIAGWVAAGVDLACHLPCCAGADLAQYLDEDRDVTRHNMCALADFASAVLDVNAEDRELSFLDECRTAVARYGQAGFKGPENPKAQLTGWALS